MIGVCQLGAGRIGRIHAANLAAPPGARLHFVVDVNAEAARALADRHGARVADAETAVADAGVHAVLIASSTDTHADLIEAAARARKAIFCEKPIDLDLARVDRCLAQVWRAGVPMMVGFNRRFDPSFAALKARLAAGEVGRVELVQITSRDPAPPPPDYVEVSGGLFRDMTIHDFDMARWLLGEEPVEVFAAASALVDPAIAALGDVDTAAVTLRTRSGALAVITNSRRAVYGYDQRVEVLGAKGMVRAENRTPTTVETFTEAGVSRDKPLHFFLERYAESYRAELDHFIACVGDGKAPSVGPDDGRKALLIAEAAGQSLKSGRPVRVSA
ncbi:MAG: inositol 2-dehydrogenase [Proteobacteria bacterium]|nr:inositol 2-dehydrogenase [Pseudomonadota bacterium]